ncbi:MAG: carbohydrate-binding domain-containing protein [Clostridia bacterium]
MKKLLSFIIILAMLSSLTVSAKMYVDVPKDAWYKEAVDFVSERGIMPDNGSLFNPNGQTSRAEYVYALYKSSRESEKVYLSNFSDVQEGDNFFSAIGWAEENNITSGVGNNLFAPNDGLTREMAMTFLYRALLKLDIVPEVPNEDLLVSFNDYDSISEWAKMSINTLVNMEIIHGTNENRIEPQKILSNAEVATIIYNMFRLKITDEKDLWKLNIQSIDLDEKASTSNTVLFEDSDIVITEGGDYTVSGNLNDGMIHINTADRVKLRLKNANITSSKGPAIFTEAADKMFITVEEGTNNTIGAENSEDGAIYSKDDLEIKGKGTLNVISKTGHGIKASDDLDIENGNIFIKAFSDGIHINDTCTLSGGNITINATGDGIDSENAIIISDGKIVINSSRKGISGLGDVTIDGGNIRIENATEGIESKQTVTINDGDIYINATDDGINSGADVIYTENPVKMAASKRPNTLVINGGNIEIYAQDDCIDSNAAAIFNGGNIKASRNRGEVIDTGAAPVTITNGVNMIYTSQIKYATDNPDNVQNTVVFTGSVQEANTYIKLADENNNEIISFCPINKFEAVTITSPQIQIGNKYTLTIGSKEYVFKQSKKFTMVTSADAKRNNN